MSRPPPDSNTPAPRRFLPAWMWAVLVGMVALAVTAWVARLEQHRAERSARAAFAQVVQRTTGEVSGQLQRCEDLLRAFQSVFMASEEVTDSEYQLAFDNMRGDGRSRIGLQALAYVERKEAPGGPRWITSMFAPIGGNSILRNLDVADQPSNLATIEQSRDTDRVAMSVPFRLLQSPPGDAPDGFIVRLPVFAPGARPTTVEERRARVIGSIGASFRIADLVAPALARSGTGIASVRLYDVGSGAPQLIYRQGAATPGPGAVGADIRFGGRTWRLEATPSMAPVRSRRALVLAVGGVCSLLLAALAWSLVSTRQRAIALGTAMSERYRSSEERFRAVNDLLPCLVLVIRRADGCLMYRNAAASSRLGPRASRHKVDVLLGDGVLASVLENGGYLREVQILPPARSPFWASAWVSEVLLEGEWMWLVVLLDISEQRKLTQRLSYQASHDSLTRLLNRREFEERVAMRLGDPDAAQDALLFIDLDQFKLINDTCGHRAGDELLVQLATLMRDRLRPTDLLGRLGGDEFGVLLEGVPGVESALAAAERVRRTIEAYIFAWEGRSFTISASIGLVMLAHAHSLKELFAQADASCYLAKDAGRNRVHMHAPGDDAMARRMGEMQWANRVRDALRDGRLLLDYQELHPLGDRVDQGAHIELLIRLRGEDGEVFSPGAFLPAAERYGLMPAIDRWVVETALANIDRLHPEGAGLASCAINLSGASIEGTGLYERVVELMDQHGIDPRRIVFEITETVAMRDLTASRALLASLRALGCRVSLDDFGAGMSSFGYLKSLELDIIKIDGSFVQSLADDPTSQSIVRAVTEIGHQHGLDVVAEWVSDADILQLLRGMRVDYAQGFALHRPQRVVFQRRADG